MKPVLTLIFTFLTLLPFTLPAQTAPGAGELVSAIPLLSADRLQVTQFAGGVPANTGADYYQILYTTPDIEGVLDTASGLLVIPRRGAIDRAMAVYQRGTPQSKQDLASNLTAQDAVFATSVLAGQGMITLTPDYLGMGEARGFHPYLDMETEATVAVDMLYAVEMLLEQNEIAWNGQLFVTGYSQGGHAAMALHRELQANYQDDWPVTRSAPMSGAYDLALVEDLALDVNQEYPPLVLAAFVITGLQEAEGNLYSTLEEVFAAPYVPIVAQFLSQEWETGAVNTNAIQNQLVETMFPLEGGLYPARLLREEYRQAMLADENHPFRVALRDNSPLDWSPEVPMRLPYCVDDDIVTAEHTLSAEAVFSGLGADVEAVNGGSGLNHFDCVAPSLFAALAFFDEARTDKGRLVPGGFIHDDSLRTYAVYIPPAYDGSEEWPVVLSFHEAGVGPEGYIPILNTHSTADTAHFLVVYPVALNGYIFALDTIAPIWNDGTPAGNPNADDVGYISRLIDEVSFSYRIDPARVYAMGAGAGGSIAAYAGCQLSDRLAAVANVGGFNACQPTREVPGLFMYGTADPFIPEEGIPGFLPPFVEGVEGWAEAGACEATPTETILPDLDPNDGSTIELFEYPNCAAGSEVLYYRIVGGGRNWPGGLPVPEGGPVNRDINADVEIWNFFARHTHPAPAPLPRLLDLTLEHQDSTRKYLLYVPADYDGSEAWPLMVNMHGLGVNRFGQMVTTQMNQVADTAHFLLVYPEATLGPQPTGGLAPSWNPEMQPDRADDIGFIDRLLDTLLQNWSIDETRMYATGMSQGGVMSYSLACNIPDRFAAIASVTGVTLLDHDWTCTANRPLPVLHMHGTDDVIVPINGMGSVLGVPFPPARDQLQFWLDSNGCAADSTVTLLSDLNPADGSTVALRQFQSCISYTGADDLERTAELWYYVIEGGGHTWPGGPSQQIPPGLEPFFGNINYDINASSEIWNFFNRHRLDRTVSTETVDPAAFQVNVFPNPFRDQLTFEFELPRTARVQLGLYNTLGQPVAQIENGQLPAGPHRVFWNTDGKTLPAGMYFYRLQVDGQVVSRPVVVGR